jgi:hypothetical protein
MLTPSGAPSFVKLAYGVTLELAIALLLADAQCLQHNVSVFIRGVQVRQKA